MDSTSRTRPNAAVRRQLRQEVGYGCPVQDCRSPFLTFHHFDPPWRVGGIHNPDGMIAMCHTHHDMADRGVWTAADLREMKRLHWPQDTIESSIPWTKGRFLLSAGTMFASESATLRVAHRELLSLRPTQNGPIELRVLLLGDDNKPLLRFEDGYLHLFATRFHDLEVVSSGTQITLWIKPRHIGFQVHFRRYPLNEFEQMTTALRERFSGNAAKCSVTDSLRAFAKECASTHEGVVPLVSIHRLHMHAFGCDVDLSDHGLTVGGATLQYGWAGSEMLLQWDPPVDAPADAWGAERASSVPYNICLAKHSRRNHH